MALPKTWRACWGHHRRPRGNNRKVLRPARTSLARPAKGWRAFRFSVRENSFLVFRCRKPQSCEGKDRTERASLNLERECTERTTEQAPRAARPALQRRRVGREAVNSKWYISYKVAALGLRPTTLGIPEVPIPITGTSGEPMPPHAAAPRKHPTPLRGALEKGCPILPLEEARERRGH